MLVHLYTSFWNEAPLLPHFLKHYSFVNKIIAYDNGSDDDSVKILRDGGAEVRTHNFTGCADGAALRSRVWKESKGLANFVIVTDVDEFLYVPNMEDYLHYLVENDYTLAIGKGYDMISREVVPPVGGVLHRVGAENPWYDKPSLFNLDSITDAVFVPGCHGAQFSGDVRCERNELKILHYRYFGKVQTYLRYEAMRKQLHANDIAVGYGRHLNCTFEEFSTHFDSLLSKAKDVF